MSDDFKKKNTQFTLFSEIFEYHQMNILKSLYVQIRAQNDNASLKLSKTKLSINFNKLY